jgi:hypothetical protein
MLSMPPPPRDAGALAAAAMARATNAFRQSGSFTHDEPVTRGGTTFVRQKERWRSPARRGRAYNDDSGTRGRVGGGAPRTTAALNPCQTFVQGSLTAFSLAIGAEFRVFQQYLTISDIDCG